MLGTNCHKESHVSIVGKVEAGPVSRAERRQWPRIPASLLRNLAASIIAGPDVKLVNLSRGGALMEVAATNRRSISS